MGCLLHFWGRKKTKTKMCIFDVCIFITPFPLIIMYTDFFFLLIKCYFKGQKKKQIFYGFTIGTWAFVFKSVDWRRSDTLCIRAVTSVDIVILTCDSLKVDDKKPK